MYGFGAFDAPSFVFAVRDYDSEGREFRIQQKIHEIVSGASYTTLRRSFI
jgi:hypothetical protein